MSNTLFRVLSHNILSLIEGGCARLKMQFDVSWMREIQPYPYMFAPQ